MRRAVALLSVLGGCSASTPHSRADAIAVTRSEVLRLPRQRALPGIAYLQVGEGGPAMTATVGATDVAGGPPVTAATMFMACSMTKVLTAIAVMQLVERGRIELDAPLSQYLSTQPYGEAVTIRQLLAHTAGIPNPMPVEWFFVEGDPVDRTEAYRRVLSEHPSLDSRPGDEYAYTNLGYWLLEAVLEASSGQDYEAYLREHIFAPLGVPTEAVSFDLPPPERLAMGHMRRITFTNLLLRIVAPGRYWLDTRDGWTRLARVRHWGRGYGGAVMNVAGLGAIVTDLLRRDGRLLGPEAKGRLFERQEAPAGHPLDATLGWVIGQLDGVPYFGKQGGCLGFQGNLRIYPSIGLGTVYMANATAVMPGPIDSLSDRLDGPMVRFLASQRP